jgi:hypothetical protein
MDSDYKGAFAPAARSLQIQKLALSASPVIVLRFILAEYRE